MLCLLFASLLASAAAQVQNSSSLPIVDLGYGSWRATINETGRYYNFSNVRYARPPVGDLRWAPPQAPLVNKTIVNDGQTGVICPQGKPLWIDERTLFTDAYLQGQNLSVFTDASPPGLNASSFSFPLDPRTTEDCLFLDVIVPTAVFDNSCSVTHKKAPVLVWIFGGGFYGGSSESQGNPAGLIAESQTNSATSPGIVYVAMNYRLGAFGWLSGPSFQNSNGTANLGLHDQRFALEWVQKNVHLFGGDPGQVTIMGGSAGASSIMHQITAYGGKQGDAPFQQAFAQSPAFSPSLSNYGHEEIYMEFLQAANATNLDDLRQASSSTLIAANQAVIYNSTYGFSGFGPVFDGTFVPNLPSLLLAQGLYSKNVKHVFTGHNTDEGLLFIEPSIQNTSALNEFLRTVQFPDASPEILSFIEDELYPPIFNETSLLGYNDTISRFATLQADHSVVCNPYFLLKAFGPNCSYAYLFDIGPGLHTEETPYTFYDGPANDPFGFPVNGTAAQMLQEWILNFGATGNPNGVNVSYIPPYGSNRSMGVLSSKGLGHVASDPAGLSRCEFWQNVLYY